MQKSIAPLLRRELPLLLFTAAIWLVLVVVPGPYAASLDASWQGVLVEAHRHHWQFGKDLIFTAGPWGFLESNCFPAGALTEKFAWEIFGKLALAGAIVALSGAVPGPRRWVFLAGVALYATLFPDTAPLLFIVLAVLVWLLRVEAPPWKAAVALGALVFFAQVKFTYCLIALLGAALAAVSACRQGRWMRGFAILAGFAAAFVALWLAAGQNPAHLPDYFRYSLEIAQGYGWGMSVDESREVFLTGCGVMLLNFVFVGQIWRAQDDRPARRSAALFLGAVWIVAWRHGFTRADDHVFALFCLSLLLALALPSLLLPGRHGAWFYANVPLCLLGLWLADPGVAGQVPRLFWLRVAASAEAGWHPRALRANYAAAAERERDADSLPAVRSAVGKGTIDLIDYEQGLLLLNDLAYRPRPIFQSYSAYTPRLMARNLRFYQSPQAPDFVLVRLGPVDGRYLPQEDALVLAELPRRYDVVSNSLDGALLRRKPAPPAKADFTRQPIAAIAAPFGRDLALPAERDHALWLQAELPLSFLGRLRALLYKPPQASLIVIEDDGRQTRYRLIPPIAAEGFLIQPLIDSTADYAAFAGGRGLKWARSIRFETAPGEGRFWTSVRVRFFRVPELAVTPGDPMRIYVDAGVANIEPVRVQSAIGIEFFAPRSLQVHAPGEMVFAPDAALRHLGGIFGLREGTYTQGGRTDGVDFVVEAQFADGRVQTVWRRLLSPVDRPGDRGPQTIAVALPIGTRQVRLRTLPRTDGDTNWDWSYWSELKFTP